MRRRWLAAGAVVAVPVVAIAVPVVSMMAGTSAVTASASSCPSGTGSTYTLTAASLSPAQVVNAEVIIGVGAGLVGARGETIGIATALVESDLRNIDSGDRDSLGLFQQRASEGWGTPAEELNPTDAAVMFYQALLRVPGWQSLDPGQAAQDVQRSAFPDRYDARMAEAQAIVDAASPSGAQPCQTATLPGSLPAAAVAAIEGAPAPVQAAIAYAAAQLGKPYVWGATGPASFDCSGLTLESYLAAGINITRTTYTQVGQGSDVTGGPYLPGDLLFPEPGHVELYIGGAFVIQAPHTGTDVQVSPIPNVWAARRIVG